MEQYLLRIFSSIFNCEMYSNFSCEKLVGILSQGLAFISSQRGRYWGQDLGGPECQITAARITYEEPKILTCLLQVHGGGNVWQHNDHAALLRDGRGTNRTFAVQLPVHLLGWTQRGQSTRGCCSVAGRAPSVEPAHELGGKWFEWNHSFTNEVSMFLNVAKFSWELLTRVWELNASSHEGLEERKKNNNNFLLVSNCRTCTFTVHFWTSWTFLCLFLSLPLWLWALKRKIDSKILYLYSVSSKSSNKLSLSAFYDRWETTTTTASRPGSDLTKWTSCSSWSTSCPARQSRTTARRSAWRTRSSRGKTPSTQPVATRAKTITLKYPVILNAPRCSGTPATTQVRITRNPMAWNYC